MPSEVGWDDSETGAGPELRGQLVSGTRGPDWGPSGGVVAGWRIPWPSFPVAAASRASTGAQDYSSSLTSYCRKKSPQTNFLGGSIHGRFLCGFSCLLAQGFSPRLRGSVLGQSPLPQPARLSQGRCLRSDPVLPAPTSILFAGPQGPEVGAWAGGWAKGEAASSFSSCPGGPPHPLA